MHICDVMIIFFQFSVPAMMDEALEVLEARQVNYASIDGLINPLII